MVSRLVDLRVLRDLGALSPELFFRALDVLDRVDVMAREDVAGDFTNIMRPEIASRVAAELEVVFRTRTAAQWLEAFRAADVPVAPVLAPDAWLEGEVMAGACPPVRVTHPFHPLRGREFAFVYSKHCWGLDRVFCEGEAGYIRTPASLASLVARNHRQR